MNIDLFEQKSSQDVSWDDLGPIWVAKRGSKRAPFGTEVEPKTVTKNDAKKGLVLGGLGGGGAPISVVSLLAGSDKGETRLPPGRLVEPYLHSRYHIL